MPGFTPEPPGSQLSFALQHKPQSERPLLRGSTSSIHQFNNNYSNSNVSSNVNTSVIRQHPLRSRPVGSVVPAMR